MTPLLPCVTAIAAKLCPRQCSQIALALHTSCNRKMLSTWPQSDDPVSAMRNSGVRLEATSEPICFCSADMSIVPIEPTTWSMTNVFGGSVELFTYRKSYSTILGGCNSVAVLTADRHTAAQVANCSQKCISMDWLTQALHLPDNQDIVWQLLAERHVI